MTKKGAKGAKEEEGRNVGIEIKGIEMYLSRDLDIDVRHEDREEHHYAGQAAINPSLLSIAMSKDHKSNLGRVGGTRGSVLHATAQAGRQQLAGMKVTKPDLFVPRRGSSSRGSTASEADVRYRQSQIAKTRGSVKDVDVNM